MSHEARSSPFIPNAVVADKRREPRRPANGVVRLELEDPMRVEIEGRLIDVSASGFRARVATPLSNGQVVAFRHDYGCGRARVVWNRISVDRIESGFLVL